MRTVLDSRSFPAEDRSELFRQTLSDFLVRPTRLERFEQVEGTRWQMPLGPGLLQGSTISGNLTLAHRPRRRREDSSAERVSLGVIVAGVGPTTCMSRRETDNARVRLIDLTSEFAVEYVGAAEAVSYEIDYARIGVDVDVVRRAVEDGALSPLGGMFRRHLIDVAAAADALSPAASAAIGLATANMARALILSAAEGGAARREAFAETVTMRIEDYVDRHLGDPALTPASIAAAHNISLRYLYRLLRHLDETPSAWIMARRLVAAKDDLGHARGSISSTAQRWGFKDHSHFTRRFRARFGVTPQQYLEEVRAREGPRDPRDPPTPVGAMPRRVPPQGALR